jgi:hypothetical protein
VRAVLDRPKIVRKLNAGHHDPVDASDTSDQRRVILAVLTGSAPETNIDESLRDAMQRGMKEEPIWGIC